MNASDGETAHDTSRPSGLELRSRLVFQEGLSRIDAHTRSRLNRARQAAVAEAAKPSWVTWLNRALTRHMLMPVTGAAAAAALVAVLVFGGVHQMKTATTDTPASALDVLDLVTDDDAMKLMQDNDSSFYEWAAAQADGAGPGAGQDAGGTTT